MHIHTKYSDGTYTVKEVLEKAEELGIKARQLFNVFRIAITGLEVTPGGATDICDIIGKEETLRRLTLAIENL